MRNFTINFKAAWSRHVNNRKKFNHSSTNTFHRRRKKTHHLKNQDVKMQI